LRPDESRPGDEASPAAELEQLRLTAGLSLRDLERATGVPRSTLSDALAGRRIPRLETVLAVVRACGADENEWRGWWAALHGKRRAQDSTRVAGLPIPAELPRDVAGFTSREPELVRLAGNSVGLIHGRPGVGKTALAVRFAHSVRRHYPDGQLFLNLRGHHCTLEPMSPVEAIGRLLGSLDVRWAPLSDDPDEGARLWRSTVAGRRLLIVLDDAVSADQVRPLLPGDPACRLVVTSRHYLADLVVHDGADAIVLDELAEDSSMALLSQVVGADRVAAEPVAAAAVAAACGHLPLALRMAGAVLAGAVDRSFADLVQTLDSGDRLTALEGLGRPSTVENAFDMSYRALPEEARFVFRRIGLHPGPDITVDVTVLLAELDPPTAQGWLHTLAEAHLIEPARADRYRLHDLLRDYAARLAFASEGESGREKARRRLFDWYIDRALAVSARLDEGRDRLWVEDTLTSRWQPGDAEARSWLEVEYRNIAAVIEFDARAGTGEYAWALVDLVTGLLSRRRDLTDLIVAADAGLAVAQRRTERRAEGAMSLRRGWMRWRSGRGEAAAEDFAHARELFATVGARRAEAAALRGLSASHMESGQLVQARGYSEAALAIYRAEGDRGGEAVTLTTLGVAHAHAAKYTEAAAHLEAALRLHRAAGSRSAIALTLADLAAVGIESGAIVQADEYAREAVGIAREIGDSFVEVMGLGNVVRALLHLGSVQEAHRWATAALDRSTTVGSRFVEVIAWDAMANASRRLGDVRAREFRQYALDRAMETADLVFKAEALLSAACDAYQDFLDDPSHPADTWIGDACAEADGAATRALDAGLAASHPNVQAQARCLLAACRLSAGNIDDALGEARLAVEMHAASGARLGEAAARCVVAHAVSHPDRDTHDPDEADRQWRIAAEIIATLGLPDTAPVRRLLGPVPLRTLPLPL
jgi:tetratricopeptide (TPR) repeat protein/transcriptional regulator with XRE-family HTH domain